MRQQRMTETLFRSLTNKSMFNKTNKTKLFLTIKTIGNKNYCGSSLYVMKQNFAIFREINLCRSFNKSSANKNYQSTPEM